MIILKNALYVLISFVCMHQPFIFYACNGPGEIGPAWSARSQDKGIAEIPILLEGNKVIVPVNVGGSSLRLIFDSGMTDDGLLIFHREKVDTSSFGNLRERTMAGAGSGSDSTAIVAENAGFSVGGLQFRNQRFTILTSGGFEGFPNDGVIGHAILGQYAVEIDYDRSVMILYENGNYSAKPGYESLPIYFKNNSIPWIDISIATGDEPPVLLAAYIDSASSEAVELLTREVNKFRLPANTKAKYLGRGLSGDIYGQEGTIARMHIGSNQLTNVLAAIVPASVRSRQQNADAVIGNNALRRFNVIFDYANRRLHIRPNSHFSEPFGKEKWKMGTQPYFVVQNPALPEFKTEK